MVVLCVVVLGVLPGAPAPPPPPPPAAAKAAAATANAAAVPAAKPPWALVPAVLDTAPFAGPPGCAGVAGFGACACAHAMPAAKNVETKNAKLNLRRCMVITPSLGSVDEFVTGLTLLRYTKLRDGVHALLDRRPFVALRVFHTNFPYR